MILIDYPFYYIPPIIPPNVSTRDDLQAHCNHIGGKIYSQYQSSKL